MKEKLMTEEDQFKLVEAVKEAAVDHATGTPATEAVVKQAELLGANPHQLKLMTDAFNTSKYLAHHKTADEQDRANTIELADYDEAKGMMFPAGESAKVAEEPGVFADIIPDYHKKVAASVPDEEMVAKVAAEVQEVFEKAAEHPRALDITLRKAYGAIDHWRKEAEVKKTEAAGCLAHAKYAADQLVAHFSQPDNVYGWGKFAEELGAIYGEEGIKLAGRWMNESGLAGVIKRHGTKTASEPVDAKVIDDSSLPHMAFRVYKEALAREPELREEAKALYETYLSEKAALMGKTKEAADKEANIGGTLLAYSGLMNAMKDKTDQAGVPPQVSPKVDLGLEGQLRSARVSGIVRDMMDEDEVIGTHATEDPARVTQAVNEIIQVNPKLLDMPIALRTAVRRHLELGVSEPHEIEQINKMDQPKTMTEGLA